MRRIDIMDTRQQPAATTPPPGGYAMKTIDFETHFATQGWVDALYANEGYPAVQTRPGEQEPPSLLLPGWRRAVRRRDHRQAARDGRAAAQADGRGRHRRGRDLAHVAGHRALRDRSRASNWPRRRTTPWQRRSPLTPTATGGYCRPTHPRCGRRGRRSSNGR